MFIFTACLCFLRVKKITMNTVDIPNTDPTTGPAIQVSLKGAGVPVDDGCAVEIDVLAAVTFAPAACEVEVDVRNPDSVPLLAEERADI